MMKIARYYRAIYAGYFRRRHADRPLLLGSIIADEAYFSRFSWLIFFAKIHTTSLLLPLIKTLNENYLFSEKLFS